jgi:hypothetical protein
MVQRQKLSGNVQCIMNQFTSTDKESYLTQMHEMPILQEKQHGRLDKAFTREHNTDPQINKKNKPQIIQHSSLHPLSNNIKIP